MDRVVAPLVAHDNVLVPPEVIVAGLAVNEEIAGGVPPAIAAAIAAIRG
jgi:hypothetical protein